MSALGYMSFFHGFVRSWIGFQFWLRVDYNKIKEIEWNCGKLSLVLETWLVDFDPTHKDELINYF